MKKMCARTVVLSIAISALMPVAKANATMYSITELSASVISLTGTIGGVPAATGPITLSLDSSGPNFVNVDYAGNTLTSEAYLDASFPLLSTLGEPVPIISYSEAGSISPTIGGFTASLPVTVGIISAGPLTTELLTSILNSPIITDFLDNHWFCKHSSPSLSCTFSLDNSSGDHLGDGSLFAVPEPATLTVFSIGLTVMLLGKRRKLS